MEDDGASSTPYRLMTATTTKFAFCSKAGDEHYVLSMHSTLDAAWRRLHAGGQLRARPGTRSIVEVAGAVKREQYLTSENIVKVCY